MRVLILGGGGMLGHKLSQVLRGRFETWVAVRSDYSSYARYSLFERDRMISGVDAFNFDTVLRAFEIAHPDAVVNAIGIIKQLPSAKDPIASLTVNALFPHRLAALCRATGARLIQISTDCVYSGQPGRNRPYIERDAPDPSDLYGRSKLLGEVDQAGCLTIRTSIIGRELTTSSGLVEWFLGRSNETVFGYTNAIFSGLPTLRLSSIIANTLERHPSLEGLYHVSADPISKYDLLHLIRDAYSIPIEIEPRSDVRIDRALNSARFREATGYRPKPWPDLIKEMAADPTPYDEWRQR